MSECVVVSKCDMIETKSSSGRTSLRGMAVASIHGSRTKLLGSEGLGQRFLATAWLTLASEMYFHKQGRKMFFIPYLSASFAVFLVLSWARKTCKHAHRVSRQQEHTLSGVDASRMFRKAAKAWPVHFSSALTLLVCVYVHASFSQHFMNSCTDHLEFSLCVLFMSVRVSYDKTLCCDGCVTPRLLLSVFLRGRIQDDTERTLLCALCLIVFSWLFGFLTFINHWAGQMLNWGSWDPPDSSLLIQCHLFTVKSTN